MSVNQGSGLAQYTTISSPGHRLAATGEWQPGCSYRVRLHRSVARTFIQPVHCHCPLLATHYPQSPHRSPSVGDPG
ncbi:MAG TPA: hypothetical protein VF177_08790 [Anaerolineae bacterium]